MDGSDLKVTIIMPAYNCEKYVAKAITGILDQTYGNWELLACDDASGDGTLSILRKFEQKDSRIRVFENSSNLKQLKTRNKLLEVASGDLITFQDADDFSHPARLELMVAEFRRNSRLGLLACQVAYTDEAGKILRTSRKPLNYEAVMSRIAEQNVVGGAVMMIRRPALDAVGGKFREYFDGLSYQDYDLSVLIAEKFEAYALPQVLYYYRQQGESSSKKVSVDRLIAKEVVSYLARQRRETGHDDLMNNRSERTDAYFEKLREPYRADPSRVHREFASNFMYNDLYRRAIKTAWQGVLIRPGKLVNWRTLQYCVRISLFKLLFRSADSNNHLP